MNIYPKITVITANYNQGSFLETTIKSVLNQNYPNLEYIIIDGKSTDNSVDVIKKYASELTYWVSEKDNGQTHAINKGLAMATGEIITWLNADDYFFPNALEIAANEYKETNFDFFLGNSIFTDANGKVLDQQYKSTLINNSEFIPCDNRCRVHQPSSFFSKKIIEKTGLLDESLHFAMDVDFWMKVVAFNGKIVYKDIDLTYFRRHEDAKSALGNLPFIRETLNSHFFTVELKKINRSYYFTSKKSIYHAYYTNLTMEHFTKEILRNFPKMFLSYPVFALRTLWNYTILKLKLKFAKPKAN